MPTEDTPTDTAMLTATLAEPQPVAGGPCATSILQAGELVAGRYTVESLLGRGGYGEVYHVLDARRGGAEVALKLHRLRALSKGALEALKAEFALLATLSHPNLARVHDFAYVEGEYAFFTQTLIEGVPLHRASIHPMTERGTRIIAQLCRALDYLHVRGIVHGDVKPSNILVDTESDRLTLLDFGIARALGVTPAARRVVGSPPYMAPEIILGGPLDARTDLYSLGITLFQLITGTVPYRGTPTDIMVAHVERAPPSLGPEVPLPVHTLVARLIAKSPGDRPTSASEVLEQLCRIVRVSIEMDTPQTLASHVLSARFIGRDREVAELADRIENPEPTAPPIVIEGPSGVGKSRLLREVRQRTQLRGQQWIQASASRAEGDEPLVASLAKAVLGPQQIASLSEEDRLELARTLPELRRKRERIAVPIDPDQARRRRMAIVGQMIAERFSWKSGAIAIEDLHWVAAPQQRDLQTVLSHARAAGARCTVLLATRPGGLDASVARALGARTLLCSELRAEASRELVSNTFGDAALLDDTAFGARLERGPSSVLWLQESLRLALERGAIRRVDGRFIREADIDDVPLASVLAARVAGLPRDARTVALAAAVLVRESSAIELSRVAGISVARASNALSELVSRGILERRRALDRQGETRERARYAMHDRYVDAVLAAASPRRARAARRRVGRWLMRRGQVDFRALERAASELSTAGENGRAVRALHRASELAARAGRPERVAKLIARELELREDDDPKRIVRLLALYDAATRSGQLGAAAEALERLTASGAACEEAAVEIELRRARQALREAELETARATASEARARAQRGELRVQTCELEIVLAEIERASGDTARSLALLESAAEHAQALGRHDLVADAMMGAALASLRRGNYEAFAAHARRAVSAANKTRDPARISEAHRALGNARYVANQRKRALVSYRRSVSVARSSGATESEAKALNNVAAVAHTLGHVVEALTAWRRAIVLKERVGAIASSHLTMASMSGVLTVMGEREEARAAQRVVIEAGRPDARTSIALAWSNRGDLDSFDGRFAEALDAYARADKGYAELQMRQLRTHALCGTVRANLASIGRGGSIRRALAVLATFGSIVGDDAPLEDKRRLATARAMCCAVKGDFSEALDHARAASRMIGSDTSFEDAWGTPIEARWMVALILHASRESRAAEKEMERARQLLERRVAALDEVFRDAFITRHPLHRAIRAGVLALPPGTTWSARSS